MKISTDVKLDDDDVILVPQRSLLTSRSEVELTRKFKFYHSSREFNGIPLISANMSCVSGFQLAQSLQKHKIVTCLHKYIDYDHLKLLFGQDILKPEYTWVSIGMSNDELNKLVNFTSQLNYKPNICVDVANGYMSKFVDFTKRVRDLFPDSVLLCGNVCTPEMVQELILTSTDIVKINIGPGFGCTSRSVAGVGFPSISCIDECEHAAHGLKSGDGRLGLICSDGGQKNSGDIAKRYCAGADFQMVGRLFASHDENSDVCEWEEDLGGNRYSLYYGMSSHFAQNKHLNQNKNYRASEGTIRKIPYKGSIDKTIQEITGGLRSCGAYIGANCLADFSKCASFVRVNNIHQNYGTQTFGL